MDLNDPATHILIDKPIEYAQALARAMWEAELAAQEEMTVRSSTITTIRRHINRKAKADLPKLTPKEQSELLEDMAHLDAAFPSLLLGELPLRERVSRWIALRDTGRAKRGVAPAEVRPGIGAAAFVLLNWRHAQGDPVTARLEAIFPKDGSMPDGAVAWTFWNAKKGEEVERLYHPSEAVRWLASELCQLDPALSGATPKGRRQDWHLAYEWVQRWREWRGLTKGSR